MSVQKISVCVSKAVFLKDAFSEEPVANGIQIRTAQGKNPIAKPGGYWLFLNMGTEPFEIEILSPVYQSGKFLLEPDGGESVEEIFLYPSSAYPIKSGSTTVLGRSVPETKLWFYLKESTKEGKTEGMEKGKLLGDYQKGNDTISVFMRNRSGRKKRNWYIWDKEKKKGEFFQIQTGLEEPESYDLQVPLKGSYRKKDTLIYPAWECLTDRTGEFFLILEDLKEQKYTLCCFGLQKEKPVTKEIEITGGKQTVCCF